MGGNEAWRGGLGRASRRGRKGAAENRVFEAALQSEPENQKIEVGSRAFPKNINLYCVFSILGPCFRQLIGWTAS